MCRNLEIQVVFIYLAIFPKIINLQSRPGLLCRDHVSFSSDDSGCDSFLLFLVVDVATTISCRDLTVLPFAEIYVATSISCRDINFVASYVDLYYDNVFLAP